MPTFIYKSNGSIAIYLLSKLKYNFEPQLHFFTIMLTLKK